QAYLQTRRGGRPTTLRDSAAPFSTEFQGVETLSAAFESPVTGMLIVGYNPRKGFDTGGLSHLSCLRAIQWPVAEEVGLGSPDGADRGRATRPVEGTIRRKGSTLKNRSRHGTHRYAGIASQRFNVSKVPCSTRSREMCSRSKFPHFGQ